MTRTGFQRIKDFLAFPLRALALHHDDAWGLSSLASERYDAVAGHVRGYCLDVGCGPHNRFVTRHLEGHGRGVDTFTYEGLTADDILDDPTSFPFEDCSFATVTFIACLNHVPASLRDAELAEAYRVLEPGGNIVVTMGNPLAEILVHKLVAFYDRRLGTRLDVDGVRGMQEGEQYYLRDREIVSRLARAGFQRITKRYLFTQWALNHLFVGWKTGEVSDQ